MSIYNKIKELETSFDPNSLKLLWKDQEFEIYPWLKPYIFSQLQQGIKPLNTSKSKFHQFRNLYTGFRNLYTNPKSIIFSNTLERRKLGDKVYDKLFHEFQVNNSLGAVTYETKIPAINYSQKEYAQTDVASRGIFYLLELFYAKFKVTNYRIEGIDHVTKFIEEHQLKIDTDSIIKRFLAQYKIMFWWFKKKDKLKHIFLSVSYTNFGTILAAKQLDLKVIEVQHGVINSEHYGYSYAYTPQLNQFPDYLLTFGKSDENFINQGNLSEFINAVGVGSFIIEYYLQNGKSTLNHMPIQKVAVSLQDCETGIQAMNEFIALAHAYPSIGFYFKRRRISLDYYNANYTFPKNIHFDESKSVYELILESDVHLTAYSSCALEATSLGKINLMFNLNGKAKAYYSEKLPPSNCNFYANNLYELIEILANLPLIDSTVIQDSNKNNFAVGYASNVIKFINQNLSHE